MRLDQNKMEWLLGALAATDCPMSCPHGRPIALQYPTREILKAFIVFELRLCRLLDCTPGGA
jgi:DNA mismatch repair protein MutL